MLKLLTFAKIILIFLLLATGCTSSQDTKSTPGTTMVMPPTAASPLTVAGTVQSVSLSAKVVFLSEPTMGIETIAITEQTHLADSQGNPITLREIQPGQSIQATGKVHENSLLAIQITVTSQAPSPTGESLTPTPTVTPLPPTPTPTPAPAIERILFAPGATQAAVEGYLPANGIQVYVMRVAAGQYIEVDATVGAIGQGLCFSIVGADGIVVKAMGEAHVRTVVPSTQDYYVERDPPYHTGLSDRRAGGGWNQR